MAFSRERSKVGLEEKGQRAARSTDVYGIDHGLPEPAVCPGCKAIYANKRWYPMDSVHLLEGKAPRTDMACPACQRMRDGVAEGIITLSGAYLLEHEDEILNTIKNEEARTRKKNPLARIMSIDQEEDVVTIRTTNQKLAEKLGRDIFRSHRGNLRYQWSGNESFMRVFWDR